jgi:hypothetical protein
MCGPYDNDEDPCDECGQYHGYNRHNPLRNGHSLIINP